MEQIRTIAIVLGDNDFSNTFRPMLNGLKLALDYRDDCQPNREQIELMIRKSILSYYVNYQYRFDLSTQEDLTVTERYLQYVKILFNEEAEADIQTKDHDGGAWYLELQSGVISGY